MTTGVSLNVVNSQIVVIEIAGVGFFGHAVSSDAISKGRTVASCAGSTASRFKIRSLRSYSGCGAAAGAGDSTEVAALVLLALVVKMSCVLTGTSTP